MEAIFLLIPVSVGIVFLALMAFVWSVSRHQFDDLEKEAERIIGLLPKMEPGKQRGRPVKVPYSIRINFKIQN